MAPRVSTWMTLADGNDGDARIVFVGIVAVQGREVENVVDISGAPY